MNLTKFFENAAEMFKNWGNGLIIVLGVILLIWGIVTLVKGLLTSGQGRPVPWFQVILMIIIGGFLMLQGFTAAEQLSDVGNGTLEELMGD